MESIRIALAGGALACMLVGSLSLAACGSSSDADDSASGATGKDLTSGGGADRFEVGPPVPIVNAGGLDGPRAVAVAGDEVIVSLYEGKRIVAVPKLGGAPRVIWEGAGNAAPPTEVFVLGSSVVWGSNAWSFRPLLIAPLGGGTARSLGEDIPANAPNALRVAEDAQAYYVAYQYFGQAGVARLQKSPPQWFSVGTLDKATFSAVASDGLRVYVGGPDAILSTPVSGGTFEPFAPGQPSAVDVQVDATHVYWLSPDGRVARLPKDRPGAPPELLAEGQPGLARMVLDGAHVHFTLGGPATGQGALRSVPKAGGVVRELASGLRGPAGLAADGSGLYVTVHGEGTVLRLPR